MWTPESPSLHVRVDGAGRQAAVLLHEMGGSLHSWDAVAAGLAVTFRVVRFDQRGFGWSEKPRVPYRPDDLVDDLERVLASVGEAGPVHLIGASAGCATAVGLALRAPDRVGSLLLCSPSLGIDPPARTAAMERAATVEALGMRSIVDMALARMYPEAIRGDAFIDYRARFLANDPVGFALANRAFAQTELELEALAQPVLLLAGRHDVRSVESVGALGTRMRNARVEVLEGAGHVMPVQAPDAVIGHALTFLG